MENQISLSAFMPTLFKTACAEVPRGHYLQGGQRETPLMSDLALKHVLRKSKSFSLLNPEADLESKVKNQKIKFEHSGKSRTAAGRHLVSFPFVTLYLTNKKIITIFTCK